MLVASWRPRLFLGFWMGTHAGAAVLELLEGRWNQSFKGE